MSKNDKIVEAIIEHCRTKGEDKNWGFPIPTINHKKMGKLAAKYRLSKSVRAVCVAGKLEVSKQRIHFLECGRTAWNLETLKKYVRAVKELDAVS